MAQPKTYTKKQFIEDVAAEVMTLKKVATREEIEKLDFEILDSSDSELCIYGQMTGNCFSRRASYLIFSCCKRFFKSAIGNRFLFADALTYNNGNAFLEFLNGSEIDGVTNADTLYKNRDGSFWHCSAIETYIIHKWSKPENIIAYLKGETNKLDL